MSCAPHWSLPPAPLSLPKLPQDPKSNVPRRSRDLQSHRIFKQTLKQESSQSLTSQKGFNFILPSQRLVPETLDSSHRWKADDVQTQERSPQVTSSDEMDYLSTLGIPSYESDNDGESQDPQGTEWMFAYGSYMFQSSLLKRDVHVQFRDPAVIKDPNIKMVFKHKGGHATLERLPPGQTTRFPPLVARYGPNGNPAPPRVHGVLYQVRKGDLKKVQASARAEGFVLTPIEVETYDGSVQITAQALVSGPLSHLLGDEVAPPEKYMRMLREGAADNFLDPVYQAWLSGIETVPSTGLPSEYYNSPSRYISYTFSALALILAASTMYDFLPSLISR